MNSKQWRNHNPEKAYAAYKRWHAKNPEKIKEYNKNRRNKRNANPEEHRADVKKWQQANPDKVKNMRLKKAHSITLEDFNNMLSSQNNKCAFKHCSVKHMEPRTLVVDHNHKTGKIRKLLCHKHNLGLGLFNDSIEELEDAIEYLEEHS